MKEHLIEGWFRAGPAKHTYRQVASSNSLGWLPSSSVFTIYRHLGHRALTKTMPGQ